jgi:hypothetical protein
MDWTTIAATMVTAVGSLVGVYISNRKSAAVMELRLKMLEDKVGKHNQIVERMYKAEGQITELQHDVQDIKGRIA